MITLFNRSVSLTGVAKSVLHSFLVPEMSKKGNFVENALRAFLARLLRPISYIVVHLSDLLKDTVAQLDDTIERVVVLEDKTKELDHQRLKIEDRVSIIENKVLAEQFFGKAWNDLYEKFEARFRGSFDLIYSRLSVRYENSLSLHRQSLLDRGLTDFLFVDLGCGRGEFLKLAKSLGYKTLGVDSSITATQASTPYCERVRHTDSIRALEELEANSVSFISLLHVIEHNPPQHTCQVFKEASRVLVPGGVILVETPSLFSLWGSSRQFFLDPTHTKPIHPEYIRFVAENYGFGNIKLIELEEVSESSRPQLANCSEGVLSSELRLLERWLFGYLDIAVWAIK